jgi:hypothetical protein
MAATRYGRLGYMMIAGTTALIDQPITPAS